MFSNRLFQGLIGFNLQTLVNDPSRIRDADNIRALLHAQRGRLIMVIVREYFVLFKRRGLLDELLAEIANEKG